MLRDGATTAEFHPPGAGSRASTRVMDAQLQWLYLFAESARSHQLINLSPRPGHGHGLAARAALIAG